MIYHIKLFKFVLKRLKAHLRLLIALWYISARLPLKLLYDTFNARTRAFPHLLSMQPFVSDFKQHGFYAQFFDMY